MSSLRENRTELSFCSDMRRGSFESSALAVRPGRTAATARAEEEHLSEDTR
jgi:hypothetical protein